MKRTRRLYETLLLAISIAFTSTFASINVMAAGKHAPYETCEIVMVGDDLIHSPLYKAAYKDGIYDFSAQFANIPEIKTSDIAIINQETILVDDYDKISSYPCFGTPVSIADDIVDAGFDVVCHATNHTYDKGYAGIESTSKYWKEHYPQTTVLGIHTDAFQTDYSICVYDDLKIGFVNYTYGLNGITRTKNYSVDLLSDPDIDNTMVECCDKSDIQIAILHVGEEYRYAPTEYQKQQVDRFIDLGADIVICAHPHVVEPYQMVTTPDGNTGLVYYSLGNFISNQTEIDRCLGGMAKFVIRYNKNAKGNTTADIAEYTFEPLFTHQQSGYYTTFKLSDYTDDQFQKHKLYGKSGYTSVSDIQDLWDKIVNDQGEN